MRPRSGDAAPGGTSLPTAELLLLPALVLLLVGALTPTAQLFPHQGDVLLYFQKADALAGGALPYRDFAFEYPPLALVAMVVPYLAGWPFGTPTFETYRWLFLAWESLLATALVVTVGRLAGILSPGSGDTARRDAANGAATRLVVLTIVAAPSLAWRFDLFPALLTAMAVLAALEGRAAVAGGAIGLGILAKLYPAILIPALAVPWLMARDARRTIRFAAGVGAALTVVIVPIVALVGDAAWNPLTYQTARGLQLESVGGGIVLLDALWQGTEAPLTFDFGAVHVAGAAARAVLAALPWLAVSGFGLLIALSAYRARSEPRTGRRIDGGTIVTIAAASIVLLLTLNKVLSVQYVVWLVPFAALLPRGQFLLIALIAVLSVGIHPLNYERLIAQEAPLVLLLNVRNALLVALLAWLVATIARRNVARPAGLEPTTFRSAT